MAAVNDPTTARRVELSVTIGGHDATSFLRPYVTSFSYTDNATGKADEIQLELQNRDRKWTTDWWPPKGTTIVAGLVCHDWFAPGENAELKCGQFIVDEVEYSGPPDKLTIKAVTAALTTGLRDTTRTKAWENYSLQGVAEDVAAQNGLELHYFAEPGEFRRVDQREESDLSFLHRLAEANGANLKVHDGKLILFSGKKGDAQKGLLAIPRSGSLLSPAQYSFKEKSEDTAYSGCEVSYLDPETRQTYSYAFNAEGERTETAAPDAEKVWAVNQRVESEADARALAQNLLRKANKDEVTGSLELIGHPSIMAGITLNLTGFGRFDGTYFVEKSTHSLNSGYTTSCEIRKTLGY